MTQEYTQRFTEVHELGYGIPPDTYSAASSPRRSGWDCLSNHQRAIYIAHVGSMDQGATWFMSIYEAQDATGLNSQFLKAGAQLTQADGDEHSTIGVEVRSEELTPGYAFTQVYCGILWSNVEFCVLSLLGCSNYPPVGTTRWTEIVD